MFYACTVKIAVMKSLKKFCKIFGITPLYKASKLGLESFIRPTAERYSDR